MTYLKYKRICYKSNYYYYNKKKYEETSDDYKTYINSYDEETGIIYTEKNWKNIPLLIVDDKYLNTYYYDDNMDFVCAYFNKFLWRRYDIDMFNIKYAFQTIEKNHIVLYKWWRKSKRLVKRKCDMDDEKTIKSLVKGLINTGEYFTAFVLLYFFYDGWYDKIYEIYFKYYYKSQD